MSQTEEQLANLFCAFNEVFCFELVSIVLPSRKIFFKLMHHCNIIANKSSSIEFKLANFSVLYLKKLNFLFKDSDTQSDATNSCGEEAGRISVSTKPLSTKTLNRNDADAKLTSSNVDKTSTLFQPKHFSASKLLQSSKTLDSDLLHSTLPDSNSLTDPSAAFY